MLNCGFAKRTIGLYLTAGIVIVMLFCSCAPKSDFVELPDSEGWCRTWGTVMSPDEEEGQSSAASVIRNATCRQVIRSSIGGSRIRLTFSNEYGDIPLVIERASIARLVNPGSPELEAEGGSAAITFYGSESVTVPAGETVVSDELFFEVEALESLAVSIYVGDYTGGTVTLHDGADTTSWIVKGDCVDDGQLYGVKLSSSWYYLSGLDIWSKEGTRAVAVIGDSISAGELTSIDRYMSWPCQLSGLINQGEYSGRLSLVNLSGFETLTENGKLSQRIKEQLLSVPGLRYVILSVGINDIGSAQADISQSMIEAYGELVSLCHQNGIRVYCQTLTPVGGNFYYSELHEKIRGTINRFIRDETSPFDGVLDFAAVLSSEEDSSRIRDEYNPSAPDYLHPGDAGHTAMSEYAYSSLLSFISEASDAESEE